MVVESGAANFTSSVTATMDGGTGLGGAVWYQSGLNAGAQTSGLPAPGDFISQSNSQTQFLLQPYTQKNAVMLDTANTSVTLTLAAPTQVTGLSFLTANGNGASNVNVTLNFSDGTSSISGLSFSSPDWFNGGGVAYNANGRVSNNGANGFAFDNVNAGNPRLYEVDLAAFPSAALGHSISSITLSFTGSGNTRDAIFGVSASGQVFSNVLTWTGGTSSNWNTSTANFTLGGTPTSYSETGGVGGAVVFDDTASNHTVNISATVHPLSVSVNTAGTYTINAPAGSDGIDGVSSLSFKGGGTLNLNGPNGYTGATTVSNGTLNISAATSIGGTSALILGDNTNTTSGTLVDAGSGAATLTGGLTASGGAGVIDTVSLANANGNLTFQGALSGTANLTKAGNGTLNIKGSATGYNGAIALNAGTLGLGTAQGGVITMAAGTTLNYVGTGISSGAGAIVASSGGTIGITNAASQVALNGNSSFGGPLTVNGAGNLVIPTATSFSGLTVSGARLTLNNIGNTNASAPLVNNGGTLEVSQGALGTGSVTLNGGVYALSVGGVGQATFPTQGLLGTYYNNPPVTTSFTSFPTFDAHLAGLTAALSVPTTTGAQPNLDFSNANYGGGAPFSTQGFNGTQNYEVHFGGYINITTPGLYTFSTTSDDGSILGIDNSYLVNNNNFQGATTVSGTMYLTAGEHKIEIGYYQGGGGQGFLASYQGPDQLTNGAIPNTVLTENAASYTDTVNINVTAGSSNNAIDPEGQTATLGAASIGNNASLLVRAGTLNFANGVSLGTSGGTGAFTISTDANATFIPGTLTTTSASDTVTLHKQGAGQLVFQSATGPLNNTGTVIDTGGGSVVFVEQSSAGRATVNFSGGGIAVTTNTPGTPMTLSIPFTYSAGGTGAITAGAPGFGQPGGSLNVNNPSIPAGNTLNFGSADNYVLNITGVAGGTGTVGVNSGTVNIPANGGGSSIDGHGFAMNPTAGVTATANVNAAALNVTSLTGSGAGTANLVLGTGGATTFNLTNASNGTFNGNIQPAVGGSVTLNKAGAGNETLSGTNTLNAVNVTAGTLTLKSAAAAGTGPITLSNNATLALDSAQGLVGFQNLGVNGGATVAGSILTLTDGVGNEARSAYSPGQFSVGAGFVASFTYKATGAAPLADGTAFVIQSSSSTVIGGGGGALGYGGVNSGGAYEINIYGGNTVGARTGLNGTTGGPYTPAGTIDFSNGDPILVQLSYDGASTLMETVTDTTTNVTYTNTDSTFSLTGALTNGMGYVGFSGATGGFGATQTVSNFSFFANVPAFTAPVSIANNATVGLQVGNATTTLNATLTLGSNATVNVAVAADQAANLPYNLNVTGDTVLKGNDTFNITNNGTGASVVTFSTISQAVAGSGFSTTGNGKAVISGATSYTGPTNIGGTTTLQLGASGSISGSTHITVGTGATFDVSQQPGGIYTIPSGQTLSGTGTVLGAGGVMVSSGATLTPGTNGGTLTLSSFNLDTGGTLSLQIGGHNNTGYLTLASGGAITLAGQLTGSLINGYTPTPGDFVFVTSGGAAPIGAFSNQSASTDINGYFTVTVAGRLWEIDPNASFSGNSISGGNDLALIAVPEPSSAAALLGGVGMLLGLNRARRRDV